MDGGIKGPFGAGESYNSEQSPPTKRRAKSTGDSKADDVARDALSSLESNHSPASSPIISRKRGREAPTPEPGAASFQEELAAFSEKQQKLIAGNIENGLRGRTVEDKLSIIKHVKTFLEGQEIGAFTISDAIHDIAPIPLDQREDALRQAKPLIQQVENTVWAGYLLKSIGLLPQEERRDILALAAPFLQRFNDPTLWRNIVVTIAQIPQDYRKRVLSDVTRDYPDHGWNSLSDMINLQVAKIQAEQKKQDFKRPRAEVEEEADARTLKEAKKAPRDAMSTVRAHVARKIIRKVIETAEQNKAQPLTPEEFEFLANRSIGLRYSEKADEEFTQGLHGDAVSLSGYPKAQLACNRGEHLSEDWESYGVSPTKSPTEGPQILEERVMKFINDFIVNGFPRFGPETTARDYIELLKLKHNIRFLLANFRLADTPYDLHRYDGIGKCGKQILGTESDTKGQGRLIKWLTLGDDFFDNLPLTDKELDLPISQTFEKIKQACAREIEEKVRLHIRKLHLMSQAF